jgi:hypothetical protein
MKKHVFFLGLILAAASASGCAQSLMPFAYDRLRRAPFPAQSPMTPVDAGFAVRGRWDLVMRLPTQSVIDVLTSDGAAHVGQLIGVSRDTVNVMVKASEQKIARADVLRIDLVDLPGSEVRAVARRAAGGALLGIAAAALAGAVIGGEAWPPPGALVRGGAAIGGVSGGQAALAERQGRLIYVAENQLRMPRPPNPVGAFDPAEGESLTIVDSHRAEAWSAIAALGAGDMVSVVRANGVRHRGRLLNVDDSSLRLDIDGAELRISRESIVRVDIVEVREQIPPHRSEARFAPNPSLGAAASIGSVSHQGGVAVPAAVPPIRMGLSLGTAFELHKNALGPSRKVQ